MADDAQLRRKIAELSSRISTHKQSSKPHSQHPSHSPSPARWSPYHHASSRPVFRNRTLVAKTTTKDAGEVVPAPAGVTTHDRGRMQWTSATVFDKKAQEMKQAVEITARAKREAKDAKQKNAIVTHVYGTQHIAGNSNTAPAVLREIIVADLRFRVASDGSKLIRVFGEDCGYSGRQSGLTLLDGATRDPDTTPKRATVAGVAFVRTKTGNMIRQGLLKNKRCSRHMRSDLKDHVSLSLHRLDEGRIHTKLCQDFTSTGSCMRGNRCRFRHDLLSLAVCKDFLRQGTCANGEDCNLSHDLSLHRVPTCTHFLRDHCTKSDCRYAHVKVDAAAPVCKHFARLGFCEKGGDCPNKHFSECPDYTNTGVCRDCKCRLPHIDRAGTLRKAAAAAARQDESADDMSMDVSSNDEDHDEIDSDDADSDEIEEEDMTQLGRGHYGHDLSQQNDFVAFT